MNIVVVGGGTPGRFGHDVVNRARKDGHRVLVLSHRLRSKDPDAEIANFSNLESTIDSFQQLISKVDHIDLFLYNTNCSGDSQGGWPNNIDHYHSTSTVNEKLYIYGFKIHVIIPHALCIEVMKKMNKDSKICFMTTDMIYQKNRTKYTEKVGYAGGKSYQHQLMLALANHNDIGVTVSSVSPHFDYNETSQYSYILDKAYNYLINHDSKFNGEIFECWD